MSAGYRYLLRLGDVTLDLSSRTHIMGILNVTPDSFSDGGRFLKGSKAGIEVDLAVEAALRMAEDGADIIDVGGESTRPGAATIPEAEEMERVLPVIEGIRKATGVPVSIDTRNAATAKSAALAGASMINDVSGLSYDPDMVSVAASTGAALVIMHMKGTPADMQAAPYYDDLVGEVAGFLADAASKAIASGVAKEKILIDVGIGFGKTAGHNLALINRLDEFATLGFPMVLGVSRKAFIGTLTGVKDPSDRLEGSVAAAVLGIARGAHVIRVHDVKAARRAALVADSVLRSV